MISKRPRSTSICLLHSSLWSSPKEKRSLWRNRPLATLGCKKVPLLGIRPANEAEAGEFLSSAVSCGKVIKFCQLISASWLQKHNIVPKSEIENSHYGVTEHAATCTAWPACSSSWRGSQSDLYSFLGLIRLIWLNFLWLNHIPTSSCVSTVTGVYFWVHQSLPLVIMTNKNIMS